MNQLYGDYHSIFSTLLQHNTEIKFFFINYFKFLQVIQEPKPQESTPTTPVRRSERAVRRRMSNTYEYEDGDLYVDEPAPARRRPAKHRHNHRQHSGKKITTFSITR